MTLPVDPERLKAEFPSLTDDDLEAYVTVTRRILGTPAPASRARLTREIVERGRAADARARAGGVVEGDEELAMRYVRAMDKMQGRVARH